MSPALREITTCVGAKHIEHSWATMGRSGLNVALASSVRGNHGNRRTGARLRRPTRRETPEGQGGTRAGTVLKVFGWPTVDAVLEFERAHPLPIYSRNRLLPSVDRRTAHLESRQARDARHRKVG
ncbi:hypothetical protein ACFQ07_22955 [Actinomadura adrarensis]|uniref:Uncharacterized protein n=1 Tax=Actinomadura adrarensis TaxID=1819600 RepID=A0ABW3CKP5_9ACTN